MTAVEFWGTWEVLVSSSLYSLYCSVLLLFYIDRWHGRLTDERALISSRSYEKQRRKRAIMHILPVLCANFRRPWNMANIGYLVGFLPPTTHPHPTLPIRRITSLPSLLFIVCIHFPKLHKLDRNIHIYITSVPRVAIVVTMVTDLLLYLWGCYCSYGNRNTNDR